MKIGVIGGGSIGLLFSHYLSAKHSLTLLARRKDQAFQINEKGITLIHDGTSTTICNISATVMSDALSSQDIIIIAVKQYNLSTLLPILNSIPPEIPLIFLQNGLAHIEQIDRLNQKTIIVGTVEHGCQKITDATVKHNGFGKTLLAPYRGDIEHIRWLISDFKDTFPFLIHGDWKEVLFRKLIINAVINPLTSILKVENGGLIENPYYLHLMMSILEELLPLVPMLNEEKMKADILKICENTKENRSSMLKDIDAGRKTEIDAILGYAIELGKKRQHSMPICNVMYAMVKGKEADQGES
ncbi:2-dehydropantoate 2-reductase [Falsibacillus albus]|nr:2-dehydropantoate 2-reductase [Falsibacillus albus]